MRLGKGSSCANRNDGYQDFRNTHLVLAQGTAPSVYYESLGTHHKKRTEYQAYVYVIIFESARVVQDDAWEGRRLKVFMLRAVRARGRK
mgnify:FL=1